MWKDVIGYEGLYKVSDAGEIFSVRTNRVLKSNVGVDGYKKVVLSVNNIRKTFRVNRLVAEAFVDNPNNKPVVNHKDGDKLNNCVNNLEWVTIMENAIHASNTGLLKGQKGELNPMSKLTANEVNEIRQTYKKHSHDANAKVLSEKYGVSDSTIWAIASGQVWSK
jgi:hypothetical protein